MARAEVQIPRLAALARDDSACNPERSPQRFPFVIPSGARSAESRDLHLLGPLNARSGIKNGGDARMTRIERMHEQCFGGAARETLAPHPQGRRSSFPLHPPHPLAPSVLDASVPQQQPGGSEELRAEENCVHRRTPSRVLVVPCARSASSA